MIGASAKRRKLYHTPMLKLLMQFIRFMRAKQKKNMNKIEKTWKEANKNKERKITDRETES